MEEIKRRTLRVEINDYKFVHRDGESIKKDIEVYKKSTVDEKDYIFVQTIRLFASEVKYMINEQNLEIFCSDWYNKFIMCD